LNIEYGIWNKCGREHFANVRENYQPYLFNIKYSIFNKKEESMNIIHIEDLEVFAYHGVNDEEKKHGQIFLISAELRLLANFAAASDDLKDTVNYAKVCKDIAAEFQKYRFDLIEKCADVLARSLLEKYEKLESAKILIKKPYAPISAKVEYVAFQTERARHTAYIGLGSNMGDKKANIEAALKEIASFARVEKVSDLIVTRPEGVVEQDDFLNGAAKISTVLTPRELLEALLQAETDLKRERTVKWGPRTIDLDILLYDEIVCGDDDLIIPHPLMHTRQFVLGPLCQIAPHALHPVLKKRIGELI